MKCPRYPWTFRPRWRARGFSWRGSSLAGAAQGVDAPIVALPLPG